MKHTQMHALHRHTRDDETTRKKKKALRKIERAWGYFLNNSTLYSKETWKQLSDPTACIVVYFNYFNWVLNLLSEAWHPLHT